jgi:hypothetical protein
VIETIKGESGTVPINYTKIISRFNEAVRQQSNSAILELIRGGSEGPKKGGGRPKKGSGIGTYRLIVNSVTLENCEKSLQNFPHAYKENPFVTHEDFKKLQEKVTLLEKEIKLLKNQK